MERVMEWPEAGRGVFAISVAAELCGLHPQTLRVYEREGLIDPERTAGGTRLYSGRDVDRLREIAALTETGINVAGVRRILELQEELRRVKAQVARLDSRIKKFGEAESAAEPRKG